MLMQHPRMHVQHLTHPCLPQVMNVLGFQLPCYGADTLLLSPAFSPRVLYNLLMQRPDVIHVSSPGDSSAHLHLRP